MKCCTGINGSHTGDCQTPWKRKHKTVKCWRCGKRFPIHWAASWSVNGGSHLDGGCAEIDRATKATKAKRAATPRRSEAP